MMRWILSLALAALTGCAHGPVSVAPPAELFQDALFTPPSAPVRAQDVFRVSPAMRAYVESQSRKLRRLGPQYGLVEALKDSGALKLDYDSEITRNAAQAFEARAGNCLSLVIMTAAFARELGLEVAYHQVQTGGIWTRSGTLLLDVEHVNISIARPTTIVWGVELGHWLTIDFVPDEVLAGARVWKLEENRIVAMYMNNRAVELLAGGRTSDAYWWSRAAIEADPTYTGAFNTLGVVYQRHGHPAQAEAPLRHALALQPADRHALGNLAGVLDQLGRPQEAAVVRAELRRIEPVAPFHDYDEGLQAMQAGDLERARVLFERELRRSVHFHELHLNLARIYLQLKDYDQVRYHLEQAREFSPTRRQQAQYSAKLERLKELTAR